MKHICRNVSHFLYPRNFIFLIYYALWKTSDLKLSLEESPKILNKLRGVLKNLKQNTSRVVQKPIIYLFIYIKNLTSHSSSLSGRYRGGSRIYSGLEYLCFIYHIFHSPPPLNYFLHSPLSLLFTFAKTP